METFGVTAFRVGLGEHDDVDIVIDWVVNGQKVERGIGRLTDAAFRERLSAYQGSPINVGTADPQLSFRQGLDTDSVLRKLADHVARTHRFEMKFSSPDVAEEFWKESIKA